MNKEEILYCLENFPFCDTSACKKCICNKTNYLYENVYYTGCCRKFLYLVEKFLSRKKFTELCIFLKEEYDGRFPDIITDTKWFVPFFKNSLELE